MSIEQRACGRRVAMTQSVEGAIRLNLCHIKAPSLQVRRYFVVKLWTKEKMKMVSKCRLTALLVLRRSFLR